MIPGCVYLLGRSAFRVFGNLQMTVWDCQALARPPRAQRPAVLPQGPHMAGNYDISRRGE